MVLVDDVTVGTTCMRAEQRIDARIVLIPELGQDIEGPQLIGGEPPLGNPMPHDTPAGGSLQRLACAQQVLSKPAPPHLPHVPMMVALARDLMTPRHDVAQ
jgi:hypothetical protein